MKTTSGSLFKRNDIFYVQWKIKGKTYLRSTGARNKKDALARKEEIMAPFLAKREADILRNIQFEIEGHDAEVAKYKNKINPPTKIADAWKLFLSAGNRPDSGEATLKQYEYQFNKFAHWVTSTHKSIELMRDVSDVLAQEYAANLRNAGLAAGTFTKHVRLLHLVFQTLETQAQLAHNPWTSKNISRKHAPQNSRRELTVEELQIVCGSAEGEMRLLFALGIYTGMRLGDCATLKWSEIDMVQHIIRRVPNKTARKNPKPVVIPIHETLNALLLETPKSKRTGYLLPGMANGYLHNKRDYVTNQIQRHFLENGIKTAKDGTGAGSGKRAIVEVGFHSLRHTFVTMNAAAGTPFAMMQMLVGHTNPAMTRHYVHDDIAATTRHINAMPSVIGQAKPILALPTSTPDIHQQIKELANKLTADNWHEIKADLIKLADNPV